MGKKLILSLLTGVFILSAGLTVCAEEPEEEDFATAAMGYEDEEYDNGADVVYPWLPSTFNVPWDKQTDEQNLQYLMASGKEPGYEGLKWWLNSGFDDITKLSYLNTLEQAGRVSSLWVMNSTLPMEYKMTYFRTHDLRGHGKDVLAWWFENVGSQLTTEQTRKTDANNYEWYTRSVLNTLKGVEVVHIGEQRYFIAKADLDKNIASGKVSVKSSTMWMDGAPENAWTVYLYYAASKESLGCKLWNLSE